MSLLNRDPAGKFIWPGAAMMMWLPRMLDYRAGDSLERLLRYAAVWCEAQAARHYRYAADAIERSDPCASGDHAGLAHKWNERRQILLDTARRIGETRE